MRSYVRDRRRTNTTFAQKLLPVLARQDRFNDKGEPILWKYAKLAQFIHEPFPSSSADRTRAYARRAVQERLITPYERVGKGAIRYDEIPSVSEVTELLYNADVPTSSAGLR